MPDDRANSSTKAKGYSSLFDPEGSLQEWDTLQCVHCSGHFRVVPGSGKIRGFCFNCNGPICGPNCATCIPTELLLENIEKGRPLDFRPVVAAFPNNPVAKKLILP